jgi:Domain of unknown function (DUF4190)/Protein of unknown function (DUF2510)
VADQEPPSQSPEGESAAGQSPPPGWYTDPNDASTQRYWDGREWTENRTPAPMGGLVPPGQAMPVQQTSTNGLAVASLVLGILWLYWVGSVLALIFGYISKKQIDESNGRQTGRGLAIAGIVLGWIGVGALAIVLLALLLSNGNSS